MKIFPVIEQVLDELYEQIPGDEAQRVRAVNRSLQMLTANYGRLTSKHKPIDYSESATRLGYIYKYVTCHSNLVYKRIRLSALSALFDTAAVRVACLGGGPGSDFLGILKYCSDYDKICELKCHLFDREIAWGEAWEDVDDKISAGNKLRTRTVYQPLDVTDPYTYQAKTKYLRQSDVFTMIYFASEVYSFLKDGADAYFDHLFSGMRQGAQVLYVDNNSSEFTNWVDEKFKTHNLKVIDRGNGTEKMPVEEEKRDLGKYFGKFASEPKLEADVAWRIALKR